MKKGIIKTISALMVFVMIVSIMPFTVFAGVESSFFSITNDKKFAYDASVSTVIDDETKENLLQIENDAKYIGSYSNYSSALSYLQSQAAARSEEVTFRFKNNTDSSINEMYNDMLSEEYATKSTYGDYLRWSVSSASGSFSYDSSSYTTAVFTFDYYDNASQEQAATTATTNALNSLNCTSSSDYDKLWMIYNYISDKADYVDDEDYSSVCHSAYSAICLGETVCQGYATQLYRMLKQVGVDNRIIVSDDHAWNIVKIGDIYYNVDLTWDDETRNGNDLKYFLRSDAEFSSDHPKQSEYKTSDFKSNYPISSTKYNYLKNVATYVSTNQISNMVYTGNEVKPSISVDSLDLTDDYGVTYSNNIECGFATAKVFGTGNYTGYAVREYKIICQTHSIKTALTKATTSANGKIVKYCTDCGTTFSSTTIPKISTVKLTATSYCYNGKVQKPVFTVKDSSGKKLVNGTDYTIKYSNSKSKSIGKYYIRITFKGNYSGTTRYSYKITPKKVKIKSISGGLRRFSVKWTTTKYSTGYQIQYSTSSTFASSKSTAISIKSKSASSKKIIDLKAKKKYYVRVRVYKVVDGKRFYGPWSAVKSVKTK